MRTQKPVRMGVGFAGQHHDYAMEILEYDFRCLLRMLNRRMLRMGVRWEVTSAKSARVRDIHRRKLLGVISTRRSGVR